MNTIAVVAGNGGYNDIGLIRSCGEAGMRVVLISPDDAVMPIQKSRYVIEWINERLESSEQLKKILGYLAEKYGDDIALFPASDKTALLFDVCQNELAQFTVVPGASGRLEMLMDKSVMVRIASECGMQVPASVRLDLSVDVDISSLNIPCIIKPLRSVAGDKGEIKVCRDCFTLKNAVDRYRERGFNDVLVQDLIDGDGMEEVAVTGVAFGDDSVVTCGMIHKKRIRGNGSTVFAKFEPDIEPELQDRICCFLRKTGYKGIFDMEFLKNSLGYHFIECNFRNGAYGYAITKAGFNMPQHLVLGMSGKKLPLCSLKECIFMEERSDILNVIEHNISIWTWLMDILNTDIFLWWNIRDIRPTLRIPYFVRRLFKKNV